MKIYGLLCAVVLYVCVLQACRHTNENPGEKYSGIHDFFNRYQPPAEQFVIDPSRDTTIIAKNGVKLNVLAGAFRDIYTNNLVTAPVRISFKQIRTVSDIIYANKPTQTRHDILETAGCFFLNAHTDLSLPAEAWAELDINKGKISIEWPAAGKPDAAMQLFNGIFRETPTEYFVWDYLSKDSVSADDSKGIYSIFPTHLQWINIDKFSKDSTGTRREISVSLPQGFDNSNTITYMVFHDMESVLSAYNQRFELIPANKKVTIITIGVKDGMLYFGKMETTTPAIDTELSMQMELSTKSELQKVLDKL